MLGRCAQRAAYSPFRNPYAELVVSDLAVLREIPEGWFIEYKRSVRSAKPLAKSVAAFANTYGGWLFLGVEESSTDGTPNAGGFPGLDDEEVRRTLQWLRQSLHSYVQPVPYFHSEVLRGPSDEIGLLEGRAIISVHVPESVATPHLHNDGRIYTRVADSSEPSFVRDRYLLDELTKRGDEIREATRDWVHADPELTTTEAESPYVRLMFSPDLWHRTHRVNRISTEDIREVLCRPHPDAPVTVVFDTIYPTENGFVARSTRGNDPRQYGLTLSMYGDQSCDVVIPFSQYSAGVATQLIDDLGGRYKHVERFVRILQSAQYWHRDQSIVDVNALLFVMLGVTRQYRALLQAVDTDPTFHFKARLLNAWRHLPFVDSPTILDRFESFGVPRVMHKAITIPPGVTPESFIVIEDDDSEPAGTDNAVSQAGRMFGSVISAFGIDATDAAGELLAAAALAVNNPGTPH